jgi:hypothetical protein
VLALGGVGWRKTAGLLVIPRYTRGCSWGLGRGCVREGVRDKESCALGGGSVLCGCRGCARLRW